jgi:hypothetical protein
MKRSMVVVLGVLTFGMLAIPAVRADVKTREKSLVKLEGMLGGAVRLFGGSAAKDGITSTVAVKGTRKSSIADTTGEIVDLKEEKVYRLDVKKKEYKVVTFAQLRQEWEDAKAEAKKNAEEMKKSQGDQPEPTGKQMEITADVKETGQKKNIAGYDAREVVLTITTKEKGKTLEESGGLVMTDTMWIGPRIAALDEIAQFDMKFIKAVYGDDALAQMQQLAAAFAMYPSMKPMMDKMRAEGGKLQGTTLASTTVFEHVKSAEEVHAAAAHPSASTGGGIQGQLAGHLLAGRGQSAGPRSTLMTTTHDVLSVESAATEADVAIPAGFKEKK